MLHPEDLHAITQRRVNRTPPMSWSQLSAHFLRWDQTLTGSRGYWRIDGRPVISLLNLTDFVKHYGLTVFTAMVLRARAIMSRRTGIEPFVLGVISQADLINVRLANVLPLDGMTGYALLPNWRDEPIQRYESLIRQRVAEWYQLQRMTKIPFFPVVAAGWDATVRGERIARLEPRVGFPWVPVVVGVTPESFGHFLDCALTFNRIHHPELNIVFLHAWNEWTESSAIEPSDRFGTAFLEEIARRSE
jgi:hypothetical protein